MNFITVKKLQREFGLSYLVAVNLLEEQHRQARKRYRLPSLLIGSCMVVFVALTIAGVQHWHGVLRWLPLATVLLVLMQLYLIQRAARAPILAAARELQARGNTSAPSRSE